jgi:hypothetical protein
MELEGSLSCSQEPATDLYCGPDETKPYSHPISLTSILILSFNLRLGLHSYLLHLFSAPELCMYSSAPMRATCHGHLILIELINLITYSEELKLWSSGLLCPDHIILLYSIILTTQYDTFSIFSGDVYEIGSRDSAVGIATG